MCKGFVTIAGRLILTAFPFKVMENLLFLKKKGTSTNLIEFKNNKKKKYKDVRFPDGSYAFVKD